MNASATKAIARYLRACKTGDWIYKEVYKFEFANYIYNRVDWGNQTDREVLAILLESQRMKYTGAGTGVQFIKKGARGKMSEFISVNDVKQFRKVLTNDISAIDWSGRSMSFTALSAWLATLSPEKLYPVPMTGFDQTIDYLFGLPDRAFPKQGLEYIVQCQPFMQETRELLGAYPVEDMFLSGWNEYFKANAALGLGPKTSIEPVDWVWLAQDFHLFVYRQILGLYKKSAPAMNVPDEWDETTVEGGSALARHMRYERDSAFIKKVKDMARKENPFLRCEVCRFSFYERYGELGTGFIEAHHKQPLGETKERRRVRRQEIALVCSNCHRMLHKGNPVLKVEELREQIRGSDT